MVLQKPNVNLQAFLYGNHAILMHLFKFYFVECSAWYKHNSSYTVFVLVRAQCIVHAYYYRRTGFVKLVPFVVSRHKYCINQCVITDQSRPLILCKQWLALVYWYSIRAQHRVIVGVLPYTVSKMMLVVLLLSTTATYSCNYRTG